MAEAPAETPDDATVDQPGDAVRRAAALGPLPGIHDEDQPDADPDAPAATAADDSEVGTSTHDEAEEAIGFRGLRS